MYIGRYDIKARRHLACDLNGITQLRNWCMDTYNHSPWRARDYMYPSTNLPRCVMPFRSQAHAFSLYDQSKVHAKGQGQRSKVKVTEVTTQLNRFRNVTPVWIHIWWNDAYSLMLLRRGALLFFKVIHQISRSHCSKNRRIWPKLAVSGL